MFFKYRNEGYTKKSNAVCSLTVVSFVVLLVLAIILVIAQEAGRSRY
jgi:ABC-type microcin C transport system permease subunit YejE